LSHWQAVIGQLEAELARASSALHIKTSLLEDLQAQLAEIKAKERETMVRLHDLMPHLWFVWLRRT
jgi:hypothetical protein